ncbi:exported hypothetical protein [Burkholderiales bacterium]|jgi:hypothetical protein|nr:exported hypothetical protein [Burkholderiales bacterium]
MNSIRVGVDLAKNVFLSGSGSGNFSLFAAISAGGIVAASLAALVSLATFLSVSIEPGMSLSSIFPTSP